MRNRKPLFAKYDLGASLQQAEHKLKAAVDTYSSDALLSANEADLVDHFVEEYAVSPIRLIEAEIHADTAEAKIDVTGRFEYGGFPGERVVVSGTTATLHVPFEGDPELFEFVASTRTFNQPYGVVRGRELVLSFTGTPKDMTRAKAELESDLANVRKHVDWIAKDVTAFNERLPGVVQSAVVARKKRLLDQDNLAASLGYPLRRRDDAPQTYSVPAKRKAVQPRRKPGAGSRFVPEPALDKATYEAILNVLNNMVQVMEQSPDAFAGMGEEDLRSHFLVQLNGQFEVGATAESFRGSGSTDILLGQDGRNVFLAECKFWKGPKSLSEALDQLLDYTIWRDAKAAVLLFNRNKDLSAVLRKIPSTIEAHDQCASEVRQVGETSFEFKLRNRDDHDRLIAVTLLAFDVPTDRSRSERLAPRPDERKRDDVS